jgi:hypothetical protein
MFLDLQWLTRYPSQTSITVSASPEVLRRSLSNSALPTFAPFPDLLRVMPILGWAAKLGFQRLPKSRNRRRALILPFAVESACLPKADIGDVTAKGHLLSSGDC